MAYEPVLNAPSRLRLPGTGDQVDPQGRLRGRGEGGRLRLSPYAIADAMMYADGKAVVEVSDMTYMMA
ncbi:MAG: hypothetical protein U0835_14130 [Isosphaeraceae bacterium]